MSPTPEFRSTTLLNLAFALSWVVLAVPDAARSAGVGVSSVRAQRFGNQASRFAPQTGDRFAWSLAVGDFNGDGADDLASGAPYDDGVGPVDSGLVIVRYGVPGGGLAPAPAGYALSQSFAGSEDPDEEGDEFGYALAACDFNGDGFDDLAVGVPGETHLGHPRAGAVQIHYGTPYGLPGVGVDFYTQSSVGIAGDVETADSFGFALACGDFNSDGFFDLAIGVPWESLGTLSAISAGMVNVIPGSAVGLDGFASTYFDQDVSGMDGGAETNDTFGFSLATGDFDGDGYADLAIGVVGEDFGNGLHGAVHIVYGGSGGLAAAGNFLFSETLLGGTPINDDYFGFTLAAGDFDGDGYDDLAVGIPYKNRPPVGGVEQPDTGAFGEVFGSAAGLAAARSRVWYEGNLPGFHTSEPNDRFGWDLASGDFDLDGFADLAIGHPGEDVYGDFNGAATILMGAAGTGLFAIRNRTLEAGLEGVPGNQWEWYQDFGTSLAAGDFDGDGHDDLAIGAPWDDEYGLHDIGTVSVLRGSLFADGFESWNSQYWSSVSP